MSLRLKIEFPVESGASFAEFENILANIILKIVTIRYFNVLKVLQSKCTKFSCLFSNESSR